MSTIAAKLKNIINCKNAIRTSINNKGGNITENSKFSDYATALNNLSTGGGSGISSVDIVKPIYSDEKAPVPNTGYLKKIFFNTNLTIDQVDSLIANANLNFSATIFGFSQYPMLLTNTNYSIAIIDYSSLLDIESGSAWWIVDFISGTTYYASLVVASDLGVPAGWNIDAFTDYDAGEVTVNAELIQGSDGQVHGAQNDLLTDLAWVYPLNDAGEVEILKTLTDQYKLVEHTLKLNTKDNTTYKYDFINSINEEAKEISTIKNIEVDPWQEDAILAKKIATYTSNRLGRVGAYAFYGCRSLTEINLPYIKTIDIHAFDYCDALVSTNIPLVEKIYDYAFSGCKSLTSISIPLATRIGEQAFSYCSSLKSITAPLVEELGVQAFFNCNLESGIFPKVSVINEKCFYNNKNLIELDLSNASYIGSYAFYNCASLIKVFISRADSVCSLYSYAFDGCYHITGQTDSTYNPNGLKDGYIYVPASLLTDYKTNTKWSNYVTQIIGHEDLTAGASLPNYTSTFFTKQTWYSDEKLTTAVTSVATSGTYYCKLYN